MTQGLDVRRSQLPRIQPETLEQPDFAEIGAETASQDGRRGPRSGRGALGYLWVVAAAGPGEGRKRRPCRTSIAARRALRHDQ